MTLLPFQLNLYLTDPLGYDQTLRKTFKQIPSDKFYTVSIWPTPGIVRVIESSHRVVRTPKISKSDAN